MEWWTTSLIHYEDFIISPEPERCWTWMGHHSWIRKLRLEVETWKVKLLLLLLFFLPMFSYNHRFFSYKSACFLGFNLNSYQASFSLSLIGCLENEVRKRKYELGTDFCFCLFSMNWNQIKLNSAIMF